MIVRKGLEEEISQRFNFFKKKYQHLYDKEDWQYIEEEFWLNIFSKTAPDILMQIYSELNLTHKDGNFYDAHLKKIKRNFDIGTNIIDIASGMIPAFANKLAYEQRKIGKGTITLYEPLLVSKRPKYPNMKLHKKEFTHNTSIKEFDLVTAIMPCEATETIIEQACKAKKSFYIAMCGCLHNPRMFYSPEIYQSYVIEKTKRLLEEYDNGQLEVETLDSSFDIDYPILYNRQK